MPRSCPGNRHLCDKICRMDLFESMDGIPDGFHHPRTSSPGWLVHTESGLGGAIRHDGRWQPAFSGTCRYPGCFQQGLLRKGTIKGMPALVCDTHSAGNWHPDRAPGAGRFDFEEWMALPGRRWYWGGQP